MERPLNLLIGDSLALLPRCALPRVAPLTPHCPATLANLSCRFGPHPAGAHTNWIRSAISATSAELSCLLCPINLFCVFLERPQEHRRERRVNVGGFEWLRPRRVARLLAQLLTRDGLLVPTHVRKGLLAAVTLGMLQPNCRGEILLAGAWTHGK